MPRRPLSIEEHKANQARIARLVEHFRQLSSITLLSQGDYWPSPKKAQDIFELANLLSVLVYKAARQKHPEGPWEPVGQVFIQASKRASALRQMFRSRDIIWGERKFSVRLHVRVFRGLIQQRKVVRSLAQSYARDEDTEAIDILKQIDREVAELPSLLGTIFGIEHPEVENFYLKKVT